MKASFTVLLIILFQITTYSFGFRVDGLYFLDYYSRNITRTLKENPVKENSIYMGAEAMARAQKVKFAETCNDAQGYVFEENGNGGCWTSRNLILFKWTLENQIIKIRKPTEKSFSYLLRVNETTLTHIHPLTFYPVNGIPTGVMFENPRKPVVETERYHLFGIMKIDDKNYAVGYLSIYSWNGVIWKTITFENDDFRGLKMEVIDFIIPPREIPSEKDEIPASRYAKQHLELIGSGELLLVRTTWYIATSNCELDKCEWEKVDKWNSLEWEIWNESGKDSRKKKKNTLSSKDEL